MVNVVAMERIDGAGDENVLPSPPPPPVVLIAPPAVVSVPVFECTSSDLAPSPTVPSVDEMVVGAVEFALVVVITAAVCGFSFPEYASDAVLL